MKNERNLYLSWKKEISDESYVLLQLFATVLFASEAKAHEYKYIFHINLIRRTYSEIFLAIVWPHEQRVD